MYESNPEAAPDSQFEPGELKHIVPGNTGRMLDSRRTPVSIAEVRLNIGCFVLRIEGFEDRGALWTLPFEKIDRYQFALGSGCADEEHVRRFKLAIARFNKPLRIEPEPERRRGTEQRLHRATEEACEWLRRESRFIAEDRSLPDPATREGDPVLCEDLRSYMKHHWLEDQERVVARTYVSNPYSGEAVRGHCIVLAQLGLSGFDGTITRDQRMMEGPWSVRNRAEHIIRRMGFVRALFTLLDQTHVMLYRGMSTDGPIDLRSETLVSASFSHEIAVHHFQAYGEQSHGALIRQRVPVDRLLMTYLETAAMNDPFKEAEAVLIAEPDNPLF